jgi:hypothetical protein
VTCQSLATAWRFGAVISGDRDCRYQSHDGDEGRCLESADMLYLDLLDVSIGQLDLRPYDVPAALPCPDSISN